MCVIHTKCCWTRRIFVKIDAVDFLLKRTNGIAFKVYRITNSAVEMTRGLLKSVHCHINYTHCRLFKIQYATQLVSDYKRHTSIPTPTTISIKGYKMIQIGI